MEMQFSTQVGQISTVDVGQFITVGNNAKESYQEAKKIFENTPPPNLLKKATKGIEKFIFSSIHFLEWVAIMFFVFLLLMLSTGGWLIIITPVVIFIFFILRRWRSPSQKN
jgi:hypothetical protein